jgi:uncharacterized protein YdhG (YjbR/CyaY superfamily)
MNSISEYIDSSPTEVKQILLNIYEIVKTMASDSEEGLNYGMPSFKTFGRPLVYFGAFKTHIGFYATPSGHEQFSKELSVYKHGKGSVQFLLTEPIPYELIAQKLEFRVMENQVKYQKPGSGKSSKASD